MSAVDAMTAPIRGAGETTLIDGRYRLDESLGGGGAAEVWRASDERLRRDVAVKLFHPGSTDTARERAEMELMAQLSHPGLVAVFDAGVHSDPSGLERSYLVIELVTGQTLRQQLARGPLAANEVAAIGAEIAAGLAYIHDCGVVHRDVKPSNILLASDDSASDDAGNTAPRAKLTDFGVARMLDSPRLTAAGTTVGTANYVSPEQISGAEVGPPSDVYSLGLVLLEALTGRLEYPGCGVAAALSRLDRAPVIPPTLDAAWADLVAAMTSNEPFDRPSAAEVAVRLSALRGSQSQPIPATRPEADSPGQDVPSATAVLSAPRAPAWRRWSVSGTLVALTAAAVVTVLAAATSADDGTGSPGPGAPTQAGISAPPQPAHGKQPKPQKHPKPPKSHGMPGPKG